MDRHYSIYVMKRQSRNEEYEKFKKNIEIFIKQFEDVYKNSHVKIYTPFEEDYEDRDLVVVFLNGVMIYETYEENLNKMSAKVKGVILENEWEDMHNNWKDSIGKKHNS